MDDSIIKKVMPHSTEAECSLIGAMLLDAETITMAVEKLIPDDFYTPHFRILFESMAELQAANCPSDLVTLQDKLKEKNVLPEYSSVEFLSDILNSVPISANAKHYADIIKEKSTLRRLIHVTEEISSECYRNSDGVEHILEETEKQIFRVLQDQGSRDFMPIREVAIEALKSIQAAAKHSGTVTGIATGFRELDYRTAGFQPSQLIIVAARPAMGKTAFALNIAEYVAINQGITTAIFSLEMGESELAKRLISMNSKVTGTSIRSGTLRPEDWGEITRSVKVLGESNLVIDAPSGLTISELRSKCRKLKLEKNLGLIIIDYLQLMNGSGRRNDSRQQEISDISRSLKALARELECPVIALSQLSRAVESREDKRPMMSDLRESGAIEQDADVVLFLYRDEYYHADSSEKGITEVIIGKQRNGPIGKIKLAWLSDYTKFANLEQDYSSNH